MTSSLGCYDIITLLLIFTIVEGQYAFFGPAVPIVAKNGYEFNDQDAIDNINNYYVNSK